MPSNNNTEYTGTFPSGNSRTVRRLIGAKGSGIKRITDAVKAQCPGSRCYVRANRDTNNLDIKAYGTHGTAAVRAAAQMIREEIAWIEGTGPCPHPHAYVQAPGDTDLLPHYIGGQGANLKKIQNSITNTHGIGCFIIHKREYEARPDVQGNTFLIEGITQVQVDAASTKLQALFRRIQAEQTPVQVDLSDQGGAAAVRRSTPADFQHLRTRTMPRTDAAADDAADTNSFGALGESSSSEDDDEDDTGNPTISTDQTQDFHLENGIDRRSDPTVPPPPPKGLQRQGSSTVDPSSFGFSYASSNPKVRNREFQNAKEAIAAATDVHPRYVTDRQVQDFLQGVQQDLEETEDPVLDQTRGMGFQVREQDFPSTSSDEGIRLQVSDTTWASAPSNVTSGNGESYNQMSEQATDVARKEADRKIRQMARHNKVTPIDIAAITGQEADGAPEQQPDDTADSADGTTVFHSLGGSYKPRTNSSWADDSEEEDEVVPVFAPSSAKEFDGLLISDQELLHRNPEQYEADSLRELEQQMAEDLEMGGGAGM